MPRQLAPIEDEAWQVRLATQLLISHESMRVWLNTTSLPSHTAGGDDWSTICNVYTQKGMVFFFFRFLLGNERSPALTTTPEYLGSLSEGFG